MNNSRFLVSLRVALAALLLTAAAIAALAGPFSFLWNIGVTPFGLPPLGYTRSACLLALCWIVRAASVGWKFDLTFRD